DREAVPGLARYVEEDVCTHRRTEDDATALGFMGRHGLTIERDHLRPVALELQPEDARGRRIDQAQPYAFPGSDREALEGLPVDRDGIADPPGMAHVVTVAEVAAGRGVLEQAPVTEKPSNVPV